MTKDMKVVVDSVDKSADKDIIIRYLIVNLARFFKRDLNFYLRSEQEQALILKHGVSYKGDGNIVCITLAEFYVDLFKHFNIEAEVVKATDTLVPLYGIIVKGTSCSYFINVLADLLPSQYGITNTIYGVVPAWNTSILHLNYPYLVNLSCEYIIFLDEEIKRFPNGIKTDSIVQGYSSELTRKELKKRLHVVRISDFDATNYKMEFLSDYCINFGQVNGLAERHKMYTYLFKNLFEGPERGLIEHHIFRDYDEDGNPINPELNIIVNDNNKGISANYVETKVNGIYTLKRIK